MRNRRNYSDRAAHLFRSTLWFVSFSFLLYWTWLYLTFARHLATIETAVVPTQTRRSIQALVTVRWQLGAIILFFWFAIAAAAVFEAATWRRDLQRKRQLEQLCQNCGYNLLRNESGVCPECGV